MSDLNLSMFRAYDIRTRAELLTLEIAKRLALAEAVYFRDTLKASGVLLAHDARSTGPAYLQITAEAYLASGLDVTVIPGVTSTSLFYFAAMQRPHLAAVMIGASHNPAGDTGQKILAPGVRPIAWDIGPEGGLTRLRVMHEQGAQSVSSARGRITAIDPLEEYIAYSMQLAGVKAGDLDGVKLFQDYLNGAAGREMLVAMTLAGANLDPLHFAADGRFPLGDPNPVKDGVTVEGRAQLAAGDCLFGTFFDGDGDRIDFYRGDGEYLSSSFAYAGILPYIRQRWNADGLGVFADLKSNPLAVMEMAKSGVRVQVIRNGHSQIKDALFNDQTMIGCVEESAHFYEAFHINGERYCTENTLYIALLAAKAWSENPAAFDRLIQIQSETAREREWGYKFPSDELRTQALDAVQNHFEAQGASSMSRMPNGYELEATLLRRGIPFEIDANTQLKPKWLQVCQRISQSEDGLARWEVCADEPETAATAKLEIAEIVQLYEAGGEYQG